MGSTTYAENFRPCRNGERVEAGGVREASASSAPLHGFKQVLCGNDGVEEAVSFDVAVQGSQIDESGAYRHVGTDVQALHFSRDLVLDFAADHPLAFRFDDVGGSGGLNEQVDLTAAAARVALVAVGGESSICGRENANLQLHAVSQNLVNR